MWLNLYIPTQQYNFSTGDAITGGDIRAVSFKFKAVKKIYGGLQVQKLVLILLF
jgi:hypothetical protein